MLAPRMKTAPSAAGGCSHGLHLEEANGFVANAHYVTPHINAPALSGANVRTNVESVKMADSN